MHLAHLKTEIKKSILYENQYYILNATKTPSKLNAKSKNLPQNSHENRLNKKPPSLKLGLM